MSNSKVATLKSAGAKSMSPYKAKHTDKVSSMTPEAVELEFSPASYVIRSSAYFLDTCVKLLIIICYLLVGIFTNLFSWLPWYSIFLLVFLLTFFYEALFEYFNKGMTPGKAVFGISVVSATGHPVNFSQALFRNLMRYVDILPTMYFLGIVVMSFNSRFQRLGDVMAGTMVVYNPKRFMRIKVSKWDRLDPIAPPVEFTSQERRTIISYAERFNHLSMAAKYDIAKAIVDALPVGKVEDPVKYVLGIAKHEIGSGVIHKKEKIYNA